MVAAKKKKQKKNRIGSRPRNDKPIPNTLIVFTRFGFSPALRLVSAAMPSTSARIGMQYAKPKSCPTEAAPNSSAATATGIAAAAFHVVALIGWGVCAGFDLPDPDALLVQRRRVDLAAFRLHLARMQLAQPAPVLVVPEAQVAERIAAHFAVLDRRVVFVIDAGGHGEGWGG